MTRDFSRLTELERRDLDVELDPRGGSWWDAFYLDRAKPCPFFVPHPDESLVRYIEEGLLEPGRAIDMGCGNGRNAIFLARHGFSVEGIDCSETAIEWARERAAQAGVAVSFTTASVFEASLGAGDYDLVYDSGCFHHIAPHRRRQYVDLVVRALRSGGRLGLTCFRPEGGSGYTDAEVYARRSLGGGLGYTEEHLREIWSGALHIHRLCQMAARDDSTQEFGKDFLWSMLAEKR
jgi:cyclopropane fatty-acyl-phospholipid synthase-like methyltransferase